MKHKQQRGSRRKAKRLTATKLAHSMAVLVDDDIAAGDLSLEYAYYADGCYDTLSSLVPSNKRLRKIAERSRVNMMQALAKKQPIEQELPPPAYTAALIQAVGDATLMCGYTDPGQNALAFVSELFQMIEHSNLPAAAKQQLDQLFGKLSSNKEPATVAQALALTQPPSYLKAAA